MGGLNWSKHASQFVSRWANFKEGVSPPFLFHVKHYLIKLEHELMKIALALSDENMSVLVA